MITKNDVEQLFQVAVRECASYLKIRDVEWKGARELIEEINASDANLHAKLIDFLRAHEDWFKFTDELIAKGGAQTDSERLLVLEKSARRDEKRSNLLKALGR